MPVSAAKKKANAKWNASKDNIMIRPTKEEGAAIRAAAAAVGQSNQQYILQATRERMERDSSGTPLTRPQEALESSQGAGVVLFLPSAAIKTAREAAEAAGEAVPAFVARAVETQAKRDKASLKLGINLATADKLEQSGKGGADRE